MKTTLFEFENKKIVSLITCVNTGYSYRYILENGDIIKSEKLKTSSC